MSLDFTKALQMENGRKVRLLCLDAQGPYPVRVLYEDTKEIGERTLDGKFFVGKNSPEDLVNVPEQVTVDVWVNVYRTPTGVIVLGYTTLTKADALSKNTHDGYVATFHIKRTVPVGHVDE